MPGSGRIPDGPRYFTSEDAPDPEAVRAAFAAVPDSDPKLIQPGDEIVEETDTDES